MPCWAEKHLKGDADFLAAFVAIRDSLADLTDHDRRLVLASLRDYAGRVRDEALYLEMEDFVEKANAVTDRRLLAWATQRHAACSLRLLPLIPCVARELLLCQYLTSLVAAGPLSEVVAKN